MSVQLPSVITALVTPFLNGGIDFASFEKILQRQLESGVKAVVVAGSTGEGLSLSRAEHAELLRFAIGILGSSALVISSCSGFKTETVVELAKMSSSEGAGALMCTIPPYLRPSQAGILKHFELVSSASSLPVLLYSVPQRTGSDFSESTLIELARWPSIIGIKDASHNAVDRVLRLSSNLRFFCGNDTEILQFTASGGVGCVSVASNVFPAAIKSVQELALSGSMGDALALQRSLLELYSGLSLENNPTAVKYFMSRLGLCLEDVRLPLCPLSRPSKDLLDVLAQKLSNLK